MLATTLREILRQSLNNYLPNGELTDIGRHASEPVVDVAGSALLRYRTPHGTVIGRAISLSGGDDGLPGVPGG